MPKIQQLHKRALLLRSIREYFFTEQVWEVDTPIMSQFGNPDPALINFKSQFSGPGKCHNQETYLITSPEYHMKRLLAQGSGSLYYLGKVFRDGELSRRHNPEFTLLEWYRVDYILDQLVDEVVTLVRLLSGENLNVQKRTYRSLFMTYLAIDPFNCHYDDLIECINKQGINLAFVPKTFDECLDILMSHSIEPKLPKAILTVIYHYPASQASLAKLEAQTYGTVGKRFELYWRGLELANGYEELTDACEQRTRFHLENERRLSYGLAQVAVDELLLESLVAMPPLCSGVAVGVDRLLMAIEELDEINMVIPFGFEES